MKTMKTTMATTTLCALLLSTAALAAPTAPTDEVLRADLGAVLQKIGADGATLTPQAVARVKKHVERILAKPTLSQTWERRQKLWPTIAGALAAQGLPEELGYLAWAESGFRSDATSPMGCKGVWQFIPTTARAYGLTVVDGGADDRLDLAKESQAAAKYLKKLMADFEGAPLLALAAYNQGETQVRRIVQAAPAEHAKDFFWLAEQGAFNEEGTEYVPKILAAAVIGMNAARYGL